MVACKHGGRITGKRMLQLLTGQSIDFDLAFPQADLEVPVFMELPLGFDAPDSQNRKHYVLRLNKSLYGLKQAGYNWFTKLRK